jgi:fumarylpyruvate hydrolase
LTGSGPYGFIASRNKNPGSRIMAYVVLPPQTVALPIAGTGDLFPVRRFYTCGGNYRQRMGDTEGPRPIMLKPVDSIVPGGGDIPYPPATEWLDHEVEMIFAVGKGGSNISRERALDHVFGYGIMFDMVRHDFLNDLRKLNRPQDICKAFSGGSPCTALQPAAKIGHPKKGAIWLTLNGVEKQRADISDLVWDVAECIVQLSRLDRLEAGDLVSTGTPAEPSPVKKGDKLHGHVDGVGDLHCVVV